MLTKVYIEGIISKFPAEVVIITPRDTREEISFSDETAIADQQELVNLADKLSRGKTPTGLVVIKRKTPEPVTFVDASGNPLG